MKAIRQLQLQLAAHGFGRPDLYCAGAIVVPVKPERVVSWLIHEQAGCDAQQQPAVLIVLLVGRPDARDGFFHVLVVFKVDVGQQGRPQRDDPSLLRDLRRKLGVGLHCEPELCPGAVRGRRVRG